DWAERDVRAAVENDLDVHAGDASVAHDAGAMPHDRRVPLGRRDHVLDAIVDDLHGAIGLEREEARVAGDHRRILFLATEPAAGLRLDDAHRRTRAEEALERLDDIEWTLHGSIDGDATVLRDGDHTVRLD